MLARFPDIKQHRSKTNKIITAPEQLGPELLTAILHRSGAALDTEVSGVEITMRKELQVSTVYRLGLSYKDAVDENRPRSLFLKLPHVLSEETRVPGSDDHAEIDFYREIAPAIGCPPLIRCFDAGRAVETGGSHLLFEDLTETHSQPEQGRAPSFEISRNAVKALAQAHGSCWLSGDGRSASPGDPVRLPVPEFDLRMFVDNLDKSVSEFLKFAELTESQAQEYRRMLGAADAIWGRMTRQENLTVTHGDMHWWNFLYPKDGSTGTVRIFDWQLWHIDLGARDLAFLLALGGFAEPRPSLEEELLRVYHDALGVPGYSFEMLIEDYRWSAIRNLNIPVIFRSQGKHESTWRTALRRAFDSYERLGCAELI